MTPFEKISLVRKVQGLSIIQKSILNCIASHLGNNDIAFLSISTIQSDCCITKRSAATKALKFLINENLVIKISPNTDYKSNQYSINFNKIASDLGSLGELQLVTEGHYPSDRRSLPQSPSVTTLVTDGHPKRNINNNEKKIKGGASCAKSAQHSPPFLFDQTKSNGKQKPFNAREAIIQSYMESQRRKND